MFYFVRDSGGRELYEDGGVPSRLQQLQGFLGVGGECRELACAYYRGCEARVCTQHLIGYASCPAALWYKATLI
jgi:hypothetical protein